MSSVLHPSGPDGPQTYWLRRVGVVVAVLIVALVVAWAWPKGDGNNTADPGDGTSLSDSATPADPSGSSDSPTPTDTGTPASTPASGSPSASGTQSTGASSPSSPSSTPSRTPSTPSTPAIEACDAGDMRVTLTGPKKATAGKKTTFKLSVINGGDEACKLAVDASTFELKIYSGTDRIWSTGDCAKWQKSIEQKTLKSEQEIDWSVTWTGERSADGCKLADNLHPGTYVATAQLTLAKEKATPVQLVMTLR